MNLSFRAGLPLQLVLLLRRFLGQLPTRIPFATSRRRRIGLAFGALHSQKVHMERSSDPSSSAEASSSSTEDAMTKQTADRTPQTGSNGPNDGQEYDLECAPYQWPIHALMRSPALFNPVMPPRHPIVLCHGLYGFDVRGPTSFPRLQMHYWNSVLQILRKRVGASVHVAAVPSTGSIQTRAEALDKFCQERVNGMDVNFMAHSMGGLDCRHLISNVRVDEREYIPRSLTTVSTPHQGSPFMDWCLANIGIGASRIPHKPFPRPSSLPYSLKNPIFEPRVGHSASTAAASTSTPQSEAVKSIAKMDLLSVSTIANLPSSFTTLLLGLIDSPAYSNLTTYFVQNVFNGATPDVEGVKYFSLAGRIRSVSILHPLWLPKLIVDAACKPVEGGNDGLVSVESARWGEFLGVLEECDHWDMRGARGLAAGVEGLLDVFKDKESSVKSSATSPRPPSYFSDQMDEYEEDSDDEVEDTTDKDNEGVRAALRDSASEGRRRLRGETDQPMESDADVRSTTDRLSSVFDWIAEHVPLGDSTKAKEKERRSDLASKEDLERLYVALCRKLYDEGL